jgi:tetratricopeptide (TPR) repeat protein
MPLTRRASRAGLIAFAVVAAAGAVTAQQATPPPSTAESTARAHRLDTLFSRLKGPIGEEEGDRLVAQIWAEWQQSGDAALDEQMQQATRLMAHGLAPIARTLLDELVARAPNWAEAWNKRATVLYLMGEHEASLADIDRVLALEPRHFGALAGIGMIRMAQDQPREALAAFRRALAVNPFLKERFGIIPQLEKRVGEKPI